MFIDQFKMGYALDMKIGMVNNYTDNVYHNNKCSSKCVSH